MRNQFRTILGIIVAIVVVGLYFSFRESQINTSGLVSSEEFQSVKNELAQLKASIAVVERNQGSKRKSESRDVPTKKVEIPREDKFKEEIKVMKFELENLKETIAKSKHHSEKNQESEISKKTKPTKETSKQIEFDPVIPYQIEEPKKNKPTKETSKQVELDPVIPIHQIEENPIPKKNKPTKETSKQVEFEINPVKPTIKSSLEKPTDVDSDTVLWDKQFSSFGIGSKEYIELREYLVPESSATKPKPASFKSLTSSYQTYFYLHHQTSSSNDSLYETLLELDDHVIRFIIVVLPFKERNWMGKDLSQVNYDYIDPNPNLPNQDYTKEEMEIFQFLDIKRRWEIELPEIILREDGNRLFMNNIIDDILGNSTIYILKGFPKDSLEFSLLDDFNETQFHPQDPISCYRQVMNDGLAASMHYSMAYFSWAYVRGKAMVFTTNPWWKYKGTGCPWDNHRCYYLQDLNPRNGAPPNSIEPQLYNDVPHASSIHGKQFAEISALTFRAVMMRFMFKPSHRLVDMIRYTIYQTQYNPVIIHDIPTEKPNPEFKYMANFEKDDYRHVDSMYPCISVHVRRGDKEARGPDGKIWQHSTNMAYVDEVRNFNEARQKSGKQAIKNLFVMSDDAVVLSELPKLFSEYKVYGVKLRANDGAVRYDYVNGMDMLRSAYTSISCEHSIITFTSNIGQLHAEVGVFNNRTVKSVDVDKYFVKK